MKKFACLVLALAMVFSLNISAVAASTNFDSRDSNDGTPPWDDSREVTVTIEGVEGIVYYVDIVWEELSFTYNGTKTWDPVEHEYTAEPKWEKDSIADAIVVNNHSNAKVNVAVEKTNASDTNRNVDFSVTPNGSETLNSAVGTDKDAPPSVSYTVEVADNAPNNLSAGIFKIGEVKVKITAA